MNLRPVKIAQNLNVAVSTVHRIYRLFEESGTVDPLSPGKGWIAGDLIYVVNFGEPINVPKGSYVWRLCRYLV